MDAFYRKLYEANTACRACPSPKVVKRFLNGVIALLFPDFDKQDYAGFHEFELHVQSLKNDLERLITRNIGESQDPKTVAEDFFAKLPEIHGKLSDDVQAMFEGDPAAQSVTEIVRSYPGFFAISAYRIAHELHKLEVKLIPRILTEMAHSRTGIDIHPGAGIGSHFCIDHGTGVVVGETSVIGNYVKIYQGVTLGGLSVDKADAKQKRHPTIQDRVVIYAGATILGGDTVIGENSIIGGNVWLTRSVPPNTKVYYKAALTNNEGTTDIIEFKS